MTNIGAPAGGICYQCGNTVEPGAPACPRCGALPTQPQPLPMGYVPPQPPQPPKRGLSTGKIIALAVSVFVLLGGGLVAVLVAVLVTRSGPDDAVKDYFEALSKGDAEKALAQTYEGSAAAEENPLLTSAALSDPARRPSAVSVGKSYKLSGTDAWRVTVAYVASGKDVNMLATVRKIDGKFVLLEAFTSLRISPAAEEGLTVNGVAVPAGKAELTAFPGSYEVKVPGTPLIAEVSMMAEQSSGTYAYASIYQRDLADGVQAEVDKQVRAKIDACVKSTSDAPAGCPFRAFLPGEKPSVKWTIPTYPKIEISSLLSSQAASARFSGSGVAHYEADYRDFFGAKKHEADNDQFYLYGTVSVKDGKLAVTFTN